MKAPNSKVMALEGEKKVGTMANGFILLVLSS